MKTTVAQRKALQRLVSIGVENLPGKEFQGEGFNRVVFTGINSNTLGNLLELGLVRATTVFLRGHASGDLSITEKGRAVISEMPEL